MSIGLGMGLDIAADFANLVCTPSSQHSCSTRHQQHGSLVGDLLDMAGSAAGILGRLSPNPATSALAGPLSGLLGALGGLFGGSVHQGQGAGGYNPYGFSPSVGGQYSGQGHCHGGGGAFGLHGLIGNVLGNIFNGSHSGGGQCSGGPNIMPGPGAGFPGGFMPPGLVQTGGPNIYCPTNPGGGGQMPLNDAMDVLKRNWGPMQGSDGCVDSRTLRNVANGGQLSNGGYPDATLSSAARTLLNSPAYGSIDTASQRSNGQFWAREDDRISLRDMDKFRQQQNGPCHVVNIF
jgi:hypothetical protein